MVSLLATPYTGGASLSGFTVFMGRLGAAAAILDEGIQAEKRGLTTAELAHHAEFYAAWDNVKTTIDITELGAGATLGGVTLYRKLSPAISRLNKVRTWQEFNSLAKNSSISLKPNLQSAWKQIVGEIGSEGSLLSKLDNPILSLLKGKVNQLDDVLKLQFLDDFANASDDVLKKLQGDNLFDVWKNQVIGFKVVILEGVAKSKVYRLSNIGITNA